MSENYRAIEWNDFEGLRGRWACLRKGVGELGLTGGGGIGWVVRGGMKKTPAK